MNEVPAARKPRKERKRQATEALTHSVNHWIRVEALAILHEGRFSAAEIAEMIGEDVKLVRGHVRDLYDSGCIEFAGTETVGNVTKTYYRAVVMPWVSPAAYREMSVEDRHDLNGAVVQGVLTESVSAYRTGKMDADEDLYLVWDAPNLDTQGKRELHDHLTATYEGVKDIHARAANRMAASGETGVTTVVAMLGFERGRPGRPEGGYYGS